MNKYGEVLEDGSMKFMREFSAPIDNVWSWLADGDKRGRWLGGGGDIIHAGQTVKFEFQHQNLTPHDEAYPEKYKAMENGIAYDVDIKTCDAPHHLVMVWRDGNDSEIDIRLSEEGGKTKLVLIQRGDATRDHFTGALAGWHAHLDIMADKLAGEAPKPFWSTHEALTGEYEVLFKDHLATLK